MSDDKQAGLNVGFIGLGRMGLGMASNLQRKGFFLTVYDINTSAVDALAKLGARAAGTVADATRDMDIVITMLPNSAVVLEIVSGPDGVLAHARKVDVRSRRPRRPRGSRSRRARLRGRSAPGSARSRRS